MTTAEHLASAAYDQGIAVALTGGASRRPLGLDGATQLVLDELGRRGQPLRLWRVWWLLGAHWVALHRAYRAGWRDGRRLPTPIPPMILDFRSRPAPLIPSEGTDHALRD